MKKLIISAVAAATFAFSMTALANGNGVEQTASASSAPVEVQETVLQTQQRSPQEEARKQLEAEGLNFSAPVRIPTEDIIAKIAFVQDLLTYFKKIKGNNAIDEANSKLETTKSQILKAYQDEIITFNEALHAMYHTSQTYLRKVETLTFPED